jgi:hypothetical protein
MVQTCVGFTSVGMPFLTKQVLEDVFAHDIVCRNGCWLFAWLQEWTLKVQAPSLSAEGNLVTIGKTTIDLANFVHELERPGTPISHALAVTYKVGSQSSSGYIKLTVAATVLGELDGDQLTDVSGLTGLTSQEGGRSHEDQDLDGACLVGK